MVYKMRVNLFYLLWIAALLFASPVWGKVPEVKVDSLQLFVQAGDSCMQRYNTFEALKHYQQAYAIAKKRSQTQAVDQLDFPIGDHGVGSNDHFLRILF